MYHVYENQEFKHEEKKGQRMTLIEEEEGRLRYTYMQTQRPRKKERKVLKLLQDVEQSIQF